MNVETLWNEIENDKNKAENRKSCKKLSNCREKKSEDEINHNNKNKLFKLSLNHRNHVLNIFQRKLNHSILVWNHSKLNINVN